MPLISVIIPLYNKENFVADTLKSALAQTFSDFEILIVNDGSTDKSAEKVLEFNDKRIRYFLKENEGVSEARNFGIKKALGNYIAFLDADDFWYPSFLETIVQMIQNFPGEKVFSSAIEVQTEKKTFKAHYAIAKNPQIQKLNFFEASHDQALLFTSSSVFEKTVFATAGNFDKNLRTDEDTDLWIRIGLKFQVIFNQKINTRYVFDSEGLSKDVKNITKKTDFSKYKPIEKENVALRKFLSIHRFSMALKSKIAQENDEFNRFYKLLQIEDLSYKQRILLTLPSTFLRLLFKLKLTLQRKKIRISAFS